jgi:Rho-binding antiterminator
MTTPIACDLHDYLEIACLYHYRVRLNLTNGEVLEGKAVDVETKDKREYLIVDADQRHEIDVTRLDKLKVLTAEAKFGEVTFKTPPN